MKYPYYVIRFFRGGRAQSKGYWHQRQADQMLQWFKVNVDPMARLEIRDKEFRPRGGSY